MARHVFLTGPPGVGKTTLIQKTSEVLRSSGVPVDGFYTEEVRQGGRRIGFDVVTLSGSRGPLSRTGSEPPPGKRECRVGQYVVDVTSFEQLALPVLRNPMEGSLGPVHFPPLSSPSSLSSMEKADTRTLCLCSQKGDQLCVQVSAVEKNLSASETDVGLLFRPLLGDYSGKILGLCATKKSGET
nr:cancer-related nucleoside-triphosphatase isoform X2 [Oryctolagus cuniculus]